MSEIEALRSLARACGVATEYHDWEGALRVATPETLVAVLRAVDVAIAGPGDAARLLDERRRATAAALAPPCAAAWGGNGQVALAVAGSGSFTATVELEDGGERRISGELAELGDAGDGRRALELAGLPAGYHTLRVEADGRRADCAIIAAPPRAWGAPGTRPRRWGLFAPVYALRRDGTAGAGDLGELAELGRITTGLGGHVVGTLPLLAGFMDDVLHEPSPYAPVSRRFWNELYADLTDPELDLPADLLARQAAAAAELGGEALVDYRRQSAWKRPVLEQAARLAWARHGDQLAGFAAAHPEVDDYARFRAAVARQGVRFTEWSAPARHGVLGPDDYDDEVRRYHLFAQWLMDRQLARLSAAVDLYLDLPIGAHRYGYDAWREQAGFVDGVSVGAPPDALFTGGQDWGLPPLHPDKARTGGHRYFRACVAAHARHAALLRVDHVMGLHRLYWVPEGASATEGTYVAQPADELYAVLCLESVRGQCAVVGEDLGTVPDQVRPAMTSRGLHRLFVAEFALPSAEGETMPAAPPDAVASLDTHDTPTLAGWWVGAEIDDRVELGLLSEAQAVEEWERRRIQRRALAGWLRPPGDDLLGGVMAGLTEQLAAGPAALVMVTVEDLWLETRPQNVPGTGHERPNWRRRCNRRLDELEADRRAVDLLRRVSLLRAP